MMNSLKVKIHGHKGDCSDMRSMMWDLLFAGISCPGFSETQKASLTHYASLGGVNFRIHSFAGKWPFQTLHRPVAISDQAIAVSH